MEQIKGRISSGTIGGSIKRREISGNITIPSSTHMEYFQGPYAVTPRLSQQVLETDNKTMVDDVTIYGIPITYTSNPYDGKTVLIG